MFKPHPLGPETVLTHLLFGTAIYLIPIRGYVGNLSKRLVLAIDSKPFILHTREKSPLNPVPYSVLTLGARHHHAL